MPPHPIVVCTAESCPGVTAQPVTAQIQKIPTPLSAENSNSTERITHLTGSPAPLHSRR